MADCKTADKEQTLILIVEDLLDMSCDQYEFMKAFCFSMFHARKTICFCRKLFKLVDGKRQKMIEMKEYP